MLIVVVDVVVGVVGADDDVTHTITSS